MARNVKTVSFSMPAELAEKLEQRARALGISKSSYVTMLLFNLVNDDRGGVNRHVERAESR